MKDPLTDNFRIDINIEVEYIDEPANPSTKMALTGVKNIRTGSKQD